MRPASLAAAFVCLSIATIVAPGCALVRHDRGTATITRQSATQAQPVRSNVADVGPRLRKRYPAAIRWVDPIDDLHDEFGITRYTGAEVCVELVEYRLPETSPLPSWMLNKDHRMRAHRLTLESSDGTKLKKPKISNLSQKTIKPRYMATREVVVGRDHITNSAGQPAATVARTELRQVQERATLTRSAGQACFATPTPFVQTSTSWIRLSMQAKLYADRYTLVLK